METENPPPTRNIIRSIALTIPMVIIIWFVVASVFSVARPLNGWIAVGVAWSFAISACTGIYKGHCSSPKIARRKGVMAGTIVVLGAAVLVLSLAYAGCK